MYLNNYKPKLNNVEATDKLCVLVEQVVDKSKTDMVGDLRL